MTDAESSRVTAGVPSLPEASSSKAMQIASALVTAMALGEFVPGQRLPTQRVIAEGLRSSRESVSAALQFLERSGYVDIRKGRSGGAFVRTSWGLPSEQMVQSELLLRWPYFEDLFELRRSVETMLMRRAVVRHRVVDRRFIKRLINDYRNAQDRDESSRADIALHAAMAECSANELLCELSSRLRAEVTLGFSSVPWSPRIREQAIVHHDQFYKAFVDRDPDHAEQIVGAHLSLTEDAMRSLYRRVKRSHRVGAPIDSTWDLSELTP